MYLGIDVGTTNAKALVLDGAGKVLGLGAVPVQVNFMGDDGVEQDMEDIWGATLKAIRAVGEQIDLSAVQAVGVSSQGGAIQLRRPDGTCVGPVVSWMDQRGGSINRELAADLGDAWFMERVGHGGCGFGSLLRLVRDGSTAPPMRVGFVGDEIVARLCGRTAHDASSLSICGFYNPTLRAADPECLQMLQLEEDRLPDLINPREAAGSLLRDIARETGLKGGIPVSVAVHDQYAASLGSGAAAPGDTLFGGGTAWVILVTTDTLTSPAAPSVWVCDHIVPERWGQLASLGIGGSIFRLVQELTATRGLSGCELDALMEQAPSGCDGLRMSLESGKKDYQTSAFDGATLTGLHFKHGKAHLLRASLEGLARSLALRADWFAKAGAPIKRLMATGGAASSRVTPQVIATTLQVPVVSVEGEISARGAAMLACALSGGGSLIDIAERMAAPRRAVDPEPESDPNRQAFLEELSAEA